MEFEDFLVYCNTKNFGVASFNTYMIGNDYYCYIMASQKGDSGQFVKGECLVSCIGTMLDTMIETIENIIRY